MRGIRFGGGSLVVNLANHLGAGIPANSEVLMEPVCGRRSGKSGPVFSRTRLSPLGMEEGSISGKMYGAVGRLYVLCFPPFLIWL